MLWWSRPDLYRPLRNDLVLTNLIGFAVFWAFPVAPPRMLPGFIDVVAKSGGLGSWHDSLIKHADQLAAMPSMHIGYAVWCSLVAWRLARKHSGKVAALVFGIGYPVGYGARGDVNGQPLPGGRASGRSLCRGWLSSPSK